MKGSGVIWRGNMIDQLRLGPEKVRRAALTTADSMAPQVEAYAKTNAPWKDQTSNARNGLAARSFQETFTTGIILYHQVPYGIWLETRFGGQLAIIEPTLEAMGPRIMARFNGMLRNMR